MTLKRIASCASILIGSLLPLAAQADSPPADARDPHAYADGYTLESGKYAFPGPRVMRLADEHSFGSIRFDRLEHVQMRDSEALSYDIQAWFGRDFDRLAIKAEGEHSRNKLQDARTELLWSHAVANFWDTQLGLRHDSGSGPERDWLAFGIQGLAPGWFEIDATGYVGKNGRTALRLNAEIDYLLTQRLILQPRVELNAYGRNDISRDIGSGLADGLLGLRLRYEISRQFAPYIGVERTTKFGETADLARAAGEQSSETRWLIGLRLWY